MDEFKTVDLGSEKLVQGPLKITTAHVLARGGPLAIVSYTVNGSAVELGLRLDMDKLRFLDDPDELGSKLNSEELPARTAEAIARHLSG